MAQAVPQRAPRPLSPHIGIYRWPLTMGLSIAHRVSGGANVVMLLVFTWWLAALAGGPDAYAPVEWLITSWIGKLAMFGYTFFLLYHLANGVRHLAWDFGYGLDIKVAKQSGIAVVAAAGALTVLLWIIHLVLR